MGVKILIIYLIVINITAFIIYGVDKAKAKKGAWRISERTLFLVAILGGGIGALLGMWIFRHKTKHWYFVVGIPAILIAECIGFFFLFRYIGLGA